MNQVILSRLTNLAFLQYEEWAAANPVGAVDEFIRIQQLPEQVATELRSTISNRNVVQGLINTPDGNAEVTEFDSSKSDAAAPSIDGFEIIKKLGSGGMGTVWLASQHSPVERLVAIKLLKRGDDSKESQRRFRYEIKALATLSHPNIAGILSAGSSKTQRPYLVLEYVPGQTITEFCNEHMLSLNERLELFAQTCDAIQHSHQKSLLHRDIKPGNVLVTDIDGQPTVKVIDFGLAKVFGADAWQNSRQTQTRFALGSPLWMSPEQTFGHSQNSGQGLGGVDTRTDIYSLGVVLYQLLTNTTPVTLDVYRQSSPLELLKAIRESPTPYPSVRLDRTPAAAAWVEQTTSTSYSSWCRKLKGDLDWVVLKSLNKDPDQRYSSVAELANDIRRFINDQPVLARPPSMSYRTRKWIGRNKTVCAASLLVLAALMGTAIVSMVMSSRTLAAESRATAQSEATQKTLDLLFSSIDERNASQSDVTFDPAHKQFLMDMIDKLDEGFARDIPVVDAMARFRIGQALSGNWDSAEAIDQFIKSHEMFVSVEDEDGLNVFRVRHKLALEYLRAELPEKALAMADWCLNSPARAKVDPSLVFGCMVARNSALNDMLRNSAPIHMPRPAEVLKQADELLKQADELLESADSYGVTESHPFWVEAKSNRAEILFGMKRIDDVLSAYEELLDLSTSINGPNAAGTWELYFHYVDCKLRVQPESVSLAELQARTERGVAKFGTTHKVSDLMRTLEFKCLVEKQMFDEAERHCLAMIKVYENKSDFPTREQLPITWYRRLEITYFVAGRSEKAIEAAKKANELSKKVHGANSKDYLRGKYRIARHMLDANDQEAASRIINEFFPKVVKTLGPGSQLAREFESLKSRIRRMNRTSESE